MNPLSQIDAPDRHSLATEVARIDNVLRIPEGAHTIPCTHGLHRFPGKFIPNLPRFLIREYLPDDRNRVIFDPFCGSGTTLVEAALEGHAAIGVDIDPLATTIARAKTTLLSDSQLTTLEDHWSEFDYGDGDDGLVPDVPNLHHWFAERTMVELSAIKRGCLALPEPMRQFCLVVFSSIIRRVSNADDQTQKTYVSGTLPKTPPLPSKLFPVFLERAIAGMREYSARLPRVPSVEVMTADARNLSGVYIDDVVTSPPYIDSIDYVHNQMLEYYWLLAELGLDGYGAYQQLRKTPMGFVRNPLDRLVELDPSLGTRAAMLLRAACERINEVSPKEAESVLGFFVDFRSHALAMQDLQSSGAVYACVVGNSWIRGAEVPTTEIITDLFLGAGYRLEDRFVYEIRRHYMKFPRRNNSGKITQDHILLFRR